MGNFVREFERKANEIHEIAVQKGWWDGDLLDSFGDRNEAELICLIHSELSEALEALRRGNPPDDKISEFSGVEAELADVVIRLMDYSAAMGYRVAEALEAKVAYNRTRSYRHGGKRF